MLRQYSKLGKKDECMVIAGIILAAVLAFCFGVGGFLFFAACGRGKEWDWLDEQAVSKTAYGKYYKLIRMGDAWLSEHSAQPVSIKSRDGLMLQALWIPAEKPRGTIIMAHGYHSCILTDFSLIYERYHQAGLNLLLPDQRSHRNSAGKFITFGVKECKDFVDWGKFHNENLGTWPIIYSGLSMGAATVMFLAGEPDRPENTVGYIADCGFTSPKEIIAKVFTQVTHLPAWPFLWSADLFARFFAGFRLDEKNTVQTLKDNTLPIILVHGLADDFVPCEMTRRSYEACGGEKELLLVENAGHGLSFLKAEQEYKDLVMAFFDRVLEEKL